MIKEKDLQEKQNQIEEEHKLTHVERQTVEHDLPGLSKEEEEAKLAEIIDVAQENLVHARESIRQMDSDVAELYETLETRDKEGMVLWNDATLRLQEMKRGMDRYEKARKKPYFGRIDFKDPTMKFEESYYVGRIGIARNITEPVVIDWRAPIASVYYENNLGLCKYTVSSEGTFEIDLKRKRTYEIANDKLKDFFDSDVVANDELLTKYLAKNKKAVLGEIIATIQKEQNLIIRRSPKTNIIVQGCAGSGKTTVAMHRISYILYNYEDDFKPEDFYIIGSNQILLNYITSVLPDLDVYGVKQMTMEQLFVRLLYEDWNPLTDHILSLDKSDAVNEIKGNLAWFQALEEFCFQYEEKEIKREEIILEETGNLLIGKKLIDTYCRDNVGMSMQSKCLMLNEILDSKLENEIQGKGVTFPKKKQDAMKKRYANYFGKEDWKGSIFDLYEEFLDSQEAKGIDINRKPQSKKERYYDVYDLAALAYLYKRIKETDPIREASHVVIDEAQDFGMMAYSCLHYCLRNCTYTIMGDTSQNIHFGYGLNDWEELRKLILTGTYDAFGLLKKSYRNTVEIAEFATEILRHGDFPIYPVEPIVRHGEAVRVTECKDVRSTLAETLRTIKEWQGKDYDTIAVVCRDEKETKKVAAELDKYIPVIDGTKEDAEFGNGVMVLPVAYTKGLEFDAVLLFNPSEKSYPAEDGYVKLLYVAATRALHELVIVHRGNLTRLIGEAVPEGKHMEELSAETLTKAKEFDKKIFTEKELEEQLRAEGNRDMQARSYIGPKRREALKAKPEQKVDLTQSLESQTWPQKSKANQTEDSKYGIKQVKITSSGLSKKPPVKVSYAQPVPRKESGPINHSAFSYGEMPQDSNSMRPKGHGRIDSAIRWIKKEKQYVDLTSSYGILRLTPISEEIVRVSFIKGSQSKFKDGPFLVPIHEDFTWNCKESKDTIELTTTKLIVRVEKKNGAVQFLNQDKTLLLSEKATEPRQIETGETWTYFDWAKNEKLKSKGVLPTDLKDISMKARYISFGGKAMRMPLVLSDKGYGIGVAAESTVLCCAIPMYGPYIHTEDTETIDYYFCYGGGQGKCIELYTKMQKSQA